MKKIPYLFLFLLFCISSCNNDDKKETAEETDVNVITNFIQAALEGNYEKAKSFMVSDSISAERMNNIERVNLSADEKKGLAAASINMHTVNRLNDSVTIVIYSNSFKNNRDTLRAVRLKGKWLVDFNYLFDHDLDTLTNPSVNKPDSIQ